MKKYLCIVFCAAAVCLMNVAVMAVPDIQFSPGGANPGGWDYVGIDSQSGTFSFTQVIDIDLVLNDTVDALFDQCVYLPELYLANYVSSVPDAFGYGDITTSGIIEIRDITGTQVLMTGTLASGTYRAVFGTSFIYPELSVDIVITSIDYTFGSAYLNSLSVGDTLDFNLSLTAAVNYDTMITYVEEGSNGFSGSMTTYVPEPATLALLALGGFLLKKRS